MVDCKDDAYHGYRGDFYSVPDDQVTIDHIKIYQFLENALI